MTLKDEIAAVMQRSACERFQTSDKVLSARSDLASYFKTLAFNFEDNTFKDPSECGPPREISDLASTRKRYIKQFDPETRKKIISVVSRVYNAANEYKKRKVDAVDEIHGRMLDAIEKRKSSPFCKYLSRIEGVHAVPGKHLEVEISGKPIDILKKSTGMPWETASCERYGGDFFDGIYSDIENCNMACFLRYPGGTRYFARVMLRWCLTENGDVGVGIEEEWYYATEISIGAAYYDDDKEIAPRIRAYQASKLVEEILASRGLMIYEVCVTPYAYEGFSDVGGSKVKIKYTKRSCR